MEFIETAVFFSLAVVAVLQPFILAIVTFAGKLGLKGKPQLVFSFVLGLVLGGSAYIAVQGMPIDFAGWFAFAIATFTPGLVAAGVYETGKHIASKENG